MAAVDTKVITAQNERTQKMLTSGLIIVDAAMEPLRVLKVLMEGLGADVKAGLWLTNFRGVPVARTLSPFDLIYLDAEYRVVHCIEISTEGEYAPFRGDPASALVLPPKAIMASKTRPGDKLQFRTVDEAAAAPTPPPAKVEAQNRIAPPVAAPASPTPPPQTGAAEPAHFFNSAFPVPPPQQVGTPLDHFLGARAAKSDNAAGAAASNSPVHQTAQEPPAPSGRLTKTAKSALGLTPTLRPANGDEPASPFYKGSVAHAIEPIGYAAPAHVEQRMSAALAAPAGLALPAEAHPPHPTPSGRLRRVPHLAPEIAPQIEPSQPVAEPAPAKMAEPATPLPVPQTPREPASKPAVVIPIKQPSTPPNESASPERAPALPAHAPSAPPAAAVPSPIPMLPAAEAPSFALAPVAKASPALRPTPPALPKPAAAPPPAFVPAPMPLITQPPIRRSSTPPAATVESQAPAAAAQPSILPPPANSFLAAAVNSQPRTAIPGTQNPQSAIAQSGIISPATPGTTDLALAGPKALESAQKAQPSWDVKLLYALFPEFDPSRPPEIRIPRIQDKLAAEIDEDDERPSRKLQILCWLYPHLKLDQVKQKRAEERRAPRLPMPGLVAYFFTGGSPRPHPIKDISVTGFYMQTDERWLPGTVIRVTLQMTNANSESGRDSVTVLSRVVRWGPDGGGFEFVLPGFMET